MPGFTTHYLFGLNAYKALKNNSLKKDISAHHAAYSLGLQGPDIFFYYLPSYVLHKKNLGSLAHTEDTNKFLHYLIQGFFLFPDKKESQIAKAYIMGFLGHYLLDCSCHPYVYDRTHYKGDSPEYYGRHMNLEVDIDTALLTFYKDKLPSSFRQESTILLTQPEVHTIAALLHYAYSMTYPEQKATLTHMRLAIRSMQLGLRLLYDPHGKKKVLTRKAEAMALGHSVFSPMMASDYLHFYKDPLNILHRPWTNPWDSRLVSRESFFDLLEKTQEEYLAVLLLLQHLFAGERHSRQEDAGLLRLLTRLGNRSYHSGLEL